MTSAGDRNAPLSPVSVGGSEWSFSKYQTNDDGSYPNNRGNLISPPISGGSPGKMSANGFPSGPGSTAGPSPPPSVARSSNGTNIYTRSDAGRNSIRTTDMDGSVLNEHYLAFRAFLTARDPNVKQPPNKARDKLLRLSAEQFFELSTDVYDELVRRQATARTPPNAPNMPPTYLLPEKSFHPKRNQARQRLSSLGPPRFRDLAADVFHELERRFPAFVGVEGPRFGSSMSMRGGSMNPMNRTGTPVNGHAFPPRGQSHMRRPSDASSSRGLPLPGDGYGMPLSSSLPGVDYARPMPRQPNQGNTIVANKSTMVEEDDDGGDSFGLDEVTNNRESDKSAGNAAASDSDKKLIEDYQTQIRELREKLDGMEKAMKQNDGKMNSMLDDERLRATAVNVEKKEWEDLRTEIEGRLTEAHNLNKSLKQELERMREDHEVEMRPLQEQAQQSTKQIPIDVGDEELRRENEQLRHSLQQQQRVTEEVRTGAKEFLREMRILSQQSSSTYEKQAELEKTIEHLELDVREWKNRYARAKTQIRSIRGSSTGLTLDEDAAKHVRDKGFIEDHGLVKDMHVTKFQMAIDELLQDARQENPDRFIDAMKSVVVSVRRITRDLDESTPHGSDLVQQGKLKAKVSATANSLITASKNFAASARVSPVSLIDAAASHLTVAIVDLLRVVKVRPTPAGELEDEDDETVTPVDSTGLFSPRNTARRCTAAHDDQPPPPAFQGLGGIRASAESSAYSPVNSPRASIDGHAKGTANGPGYIDTSNGYGMQHHDDQLKDLKIYLEDQVALLVSDVQSLVNCVRTDAHIRQISTEIESINAIVGKVMSETRSSGHGDMIVRLSDCRDRLLEAGQRGQEMANSGVADHDWRGWTQTLPPIAFDIARETKELIQGIGKTGDATGCGRFPMKWTS